MSDNVDQKWEDMLKQMTPEEKRAFLRAVLRVRAHCRRCLVKNRQLHRDPCYGCIIMPKGLRRFISTVN